jgi:hypothetical protein
MIKKAPTDDRKSDMKMDLSPFDLIRFKLSEYSAESEVLNLFFFLKITIETKEPIIPKAYIATALRKPLSKV